MDASPAGCAYRLEVAEEWFHDRCTDNHSRYSHQLVCERERQKRGVVVHVFDVLSYTAVSVLELIDIYLFIILVQEDNHSIAQAHGGLSYGPVQSAYQGSWLSDAGV